jgi:hypothetical protein
MINTLYNVEVAGSRLGECNVFFLIKIICPLSKPQKIYKPKNVCLPRAHVSGLFGIRLLMTYFFSFFYYFIILYFNVKLLLYGIETTINPFLYFLACNKISKNIYDTPYINFLGFKKT